MVGYLFGPGQQYQTPEELARARVVAEALLGQQPIAHNVGEGLAVLGQAIKGRRELNAITKAQAAGRAQGDSVFSALFGGGAGGSTPAPSGNAVANALGGSTANLPDVDVSKSVSGAVDPQTIFAGLKARGLNDAQAYATLGNWKQESEFRPGAINPQEGAIGFDQWRLERRSDLENFAKKAGKSPTDPEVQMDFYVDELKRHPGGKDFLAANDITSANRALKGYILYGSPYDKGGEGTRLANALAYQKLGYGSGAPVQIASTDPGAGVAAALNGAPPAAKPAPQGASPVAAALSPRATEPAPVAAAPRPAPAQAAQVAQAAPQQSGTPSVQQLLKAAQDPWLSESQRGVVNLLLKQAMDQADPANKLDMEYKRAQLDALEHPKPKFDFITGRDGAIFRTDQNGNMEQVYGGKPKASHVLTPDEKVKLGLPPDGNFQSDEEGKISQIGGNGTTVNIDQKSEGAFDKKLAENQATMLTDMAKNGLDAKADLGVVGELGNLLAHQPGGMMTGISGWLAQKGIGGEGMGDLQAADALINKLIPSQRQAGSGSMSDRDVEMFRASLPSLWKTPEGNQKVLQVMQSLAQYRIAQGEIATKAMNGEVTRQEASKMLGELPNPLAGFDKLAPSPKADSAKKSTVIDGYTIEEVP